MHNERTIVENFNKDITSKIGGKREISDFGRYYSENPKRLAEMDQKIRTDEANLRRKRQDLDEERKLLDEESSQSKHKHNQLTEYLDRVEKGIETMKEQTNDSESIQGNLGHLEMIRDNVKSELTKLTSSDEYAAQVEADDAWTKKQGEYREKLSQFDDFLQRNKEDLAKWRIAQIETIIRDSQDYHPQKDDYKFPETPAQREEEANKIISRVDIIGPYWIKLGENGPQEKKDEIEIQKLHLKNSVDAFGQNEQDSNREFQVRSEINTLLQMGVGKSEIQDLVNSWRYLGSYQPGKGAESSEDRAIARLKGSEAKSGEASILKDQRLEAHKKELFDRGLSEKAFALGKTKRDLRQADASSKQKLTDDSEFQIYQIKSHILSELDRVTGYGGLNLDETKIGIACRQ